MSNLIFNKRSFFLIEIIFCILILSIVYTQIIGKKKSIKLDQAINKIIIHLKQTRYQAMIDNKFDDQDKYWFRKRWTFKVSKCEKTIGGLYYLIYSDLNKGGNININETLKDPLNNKFLYSNNNCKSSYNTSKDILITKKYGINKIEQSCNKSNTIVKIHFGYDGSIYNKLSGNKAIDQEYSFKLQNICEIRIYDDKDNYKTIIIESNTGYIYLKYPD